MKAAAKKAKRGRRALPIVLLPDNIRVFVKRRGRLADFFYEESFNSASKAQERTRNTLQVVRAIMGPRIKVSATVRGKRVVMRMRGRVDHATIGTMLAGEFFAWSHAANMPLRDLIGRMLAARAVGA